MLCIMNASITIAVRALVLTAFFSAALAPAEAARDAEAVPAFRLRARVVSFGETAPTDADKTRFYLSGGEKQNVAAGDAWCDELTVDAALIERALKNYPNTYMRDWPVALEFNAYAPRFPAQVELEVRLPDVPADAPPTFTYALDLLARNCKLLIWPDDESGAMRIAPSVVYNRRYWKHLEGVSLGPDERPKKIIVADRFIGDGDLNNWREGMTNLAKAGFNAMLMPPAPVYRDLLREVGDHKLTYAVYNPPGYAFDFADDITPESIREWADKLAEPFIDAGFDPGEMALYAMSDEPGWYFPKVLRDLEASAKGMARFHAYLRDQGLTPADVGAATWDEVKPLGRSQLSDLPSHRLHYWTTRFIAYDSAVHFANSSRALEEAFYPGMPVVTNWNFFSGRFYHAGSFGNNPDKTSPDVAMGCHDWFEFARLRGCNMLWTEDWFGDNRAWQWSFYTSKLDSAARKNGLTFGGYVVPRTSGGRESGLLQRILAVVGGGGKAIKHYVFGPEYMFPGNCYSDKSFLLPRIAEAHRMIAAAEDLLYPGQRPLPQVAILQPRSALVWDGKGMADTKIVDATNVALERHTVDYMAEVFGLYLALQHANIPVAWVEEDDLSAEGLKDYHVLYVTEPNIPVEHLRGLRAWVEAGGTLVTAPGAGACDRYDQPVDASVSLGTSPRQRVLVDDVRKATELHPSLDSELTAESRSIGSGRIVHFPIFAGIGYIVSSKEQRDGLPVGHSEALRDYVVAPISDAGVQQPVEVSVAMIETPMLVSEGGAAITVLNWTGQDHDRVEFVVRTPIAVREVRAVKAGPVEFEKTDAGVKFAIPVGPAEIVMLRP